MEVNNKQLNILNIIIWFLKILMNILGLIIGLLSIPLVLIGFLGWYLFLSIEYFGIPIHDKDDDIYLSGPLRGLPKN